MHTDFNSVEAELQEIEADFASGRMNAFGSTTMQETFLRELKRIAEIETQVFYKTCGILKTSNAQEHAMLASMYASAQPPAQSRSSGATPKASSTSPGRGGHAYDSSSVRTRGPLPTSPTMDSSMPSLMVSTTNSPGQGGPGYATAYGGSTGLDRGGSTRGASRGVGDGGPAAAPHIRPGDWNNENGFSDKAFDDVEGHFHMLETEFATLGEYLRQISSHVTQLNAFSEQMNAMTGTGQSGSMTSTGGGPAGGDASTASPASPSTTTTAMGAASGGGGGVGVPSMNATMSLTGGAMEAVPPRWR